MEIDGLLCPREILELLSHTRMLVTIGGGLHTYVVPNLDPIFHFDCSFRRIPGPVLFMACCVLFVRRLFTSMSYLHLHVKSKPSLHLSHQELIPSRVSFPSYHSSTNLAHLQHAVHRFSLSISSPMPFQRPTMYIRSLRCTFQRGKLRILL